MENFEMHIMTLILIIVVIYDVIIKKCNKKERNFLVLLLLSFISFTIFDLMQFECLAIISFSIFFSIFYIYNMVSFFKDRNTPKIIKTKLKILNIILVICIIFIIIMMTPIYDTLIKPLFKSN